MIKFGEFLKKVPVPSSLNVFHMAPLRGSALFVMDAFLVYLIVDYFFGGKGQTHVKPEGRDFTPVQLRIIKKLLLQSLVDLGKAWHAVVPINVEYVRSESNPQFAMVVTSSEIVVVVTLQVILGETARELYIVYPTACSSRSKRNSIPASSPITSIKTASGAIDSESDYTSVRFRLRYGWNRHCHGEGRDEFFTGRRDLTRPASRGSSRLLHRGAPQISGQSWHLQGQSRMPRDQSIELVMTLLRE